MWRQEGFRSFYKGITPRVLRVAPGMYVHVILITVADEASRSGHRIWGVRACQEAHRDSEGIAH